MLKKLNLNNTFHIISYKELIKRGNTSSLTSSLSKKKMDGIIPAVLYVFFMVSILTPNEPPELNGHEVPYTDNIAIFESGGPRVRCHSDNPELCKELAFTPGIHFAVTCVDHNYRFCLYGVTTNISKSPIRVPDRHHHIYSEHRQLVLTKRNVTLTDMTLYCATGEEDDIYLNVYID